MKLKDYQNDVLVQLSRYLAALAQRRREVVEFAEFQKSKGHTPTPGDFCRLTWETYFNSRERPPYIQRQDSLGRPVPNLCLKVPTGGGKTLLAAASVERINVEYFQTQTGLVLWIVPSDAIYTQTWKAFADRMHPYRQMLERASAGRVKLLEKNDAFAPADVRDSLCVMLMMMQAGGVRRESRESRKMFQDSGKYPGFFPDEDDAKANNELIRQMPVLDHSGDLMQGICVTQSLGNVLKLVQPLVVIDEGHKAYTDTQLAAIASYNPKFILELSATPNVREHASNIVVNVPGTALHGEEMIKLPINVFNADRGEWKQALEAAQEKLNELAKESRKAQRTEGRYIRPILLIRVERTGKDQQDKHEIHSDTIRQHLITKLGAKEDEIRIKSAEKDELGDEDLLAETCPVRYIITKDALREGWDCPFAYVLAVLSQTTAGTAVTQMVGRILRQPNGKRLKAEPLNECFVYTIDRSVQEAVESVKEGLQSEGLGDLAASVRTSGVASGVASRREVIKRREAFRNLAIFLPRVLARSPDGKTWRPFDYDRDLLARIDWEKLEYSGADDYTPDAAESIRFTHARVNLQQSSAPNLAGDFAVEADLDLPGLVRLLGDVVPNPWQSARILNTALKKIGKRYSLERIAANRLGLLNAIRSDLEQQVNKAGEKEFRQALANGDICFRLDASNDRKLNWELAQEFVIDVIPGEFELRSRNGAPLQRTLLEKVFEKEFNELERDVALYLDDEKAIQWWHRIAVKADWHLQGWQRQRVYPDFLVSLHGAGKGKLKFTVLETKGSHLQGNADTEYKKRLFDLLTEHSKTAIPVGDLFVQFKEQHIKFELLLENDWHQKLNEALSKI